MLIYKINVIEELNNIGMTYSNVRKNCMFSQSTMSKFAKGDTNISASVLNNLCCVLEMQPRDILKYVESEEDKEYLSRK